jgi:hypothetical protein
MQRGGVISAELEQRLRALGIDIADVHKCLEKFCHDERRC